MIGIYKIVNPKGRVYIGQSVNILERKQKYEYLNCKGQVRLYASMLKYGFLKHTFEIVEECSMEELNGRERYWQDYYDVLSKNGLNCKLTKTEDKSGSLSENTKQKISTSNKGKVRTEQQRQAISERLKGKPSSRKNFKHSEETKAKISTARKGIERGPHRENTKQKISERLLKYRNVGCYTLEGVLVKVYDTINDVEIDNFSKVNVSRCLAGCRKSHKKYVWKVAY